VVIKADGLAAGKGVVVPESLSEAIDAVRDMLVSRAHGEAGETIVIEERLQGAEASLLALCDGKSVVSLLPSQDHKRLHDNNLGPNTGGMGAFCPSPLVSDSMMQEINETIMRATVDGLAKEGHPFIGCLFAGLMITPDGVKVLEFNCRFGDPETQSILPLLQSDLFHLMDDCVNGNMKPGCVSFKKGACSVVTMASKGYPLKSVEGFAIEGLPEVKDLPGVMVFHAGTRVKGQTTESCLNKRPRRVETAGGRVLSVAGVGSNVEEASRVAYGGVKCITFDGAQFRTDIGTNGGTSL